MIRLKMFESSVIRQVFLGTSQTSISEIINGRLYLGNMSHSLSRAILKALGIKRIVNISQDIACSFPDDFEYYHIKIDDHPKENIYGYLDDAYHFIESSPGPVFVHCRMGISRSSSIVIAYIGKKFNLPYEQVYEIVKHRRHCISPNHGFKAQLKKYLNK